MNDKLASDYADSLIEGIRANVDAGYPFGYDAERGEEIEAVLSAYDYLEDALDILYVVTSNKEYRGAMIQIAWGGPGAWIDTTDRTLTVSWGDKAVRYLPSEFIDALDEALAELWAIN